jgi:hypothetical protein
MMLSDISEYDIRDSETYNIQLQYAFNSFVKKCKVSKRGLTDHERQILDYCFEKSIHPLYPALNELEPSYKGHTAYRRCAHDLLHTMIGLLEYWVSMVITIVAKIGADMPRYRRNICILEDLLGRFPHRQAMPFRVKHFIKGLKAYIPGLNKDIQQKATGYGTVGMMDNKDVPSLILQLLLCK